MLKDAPPTTEIRSALAWLVRLNDDRAPPELTRQFEHWLGAAPENRAAWDEAKALWSVMAPVKSELDTIRRRDRLVSRRQVVAGLIGAGVISAGGWHVSRPWFGADFTTVAGQTRDITLADGTLVNLGSRSAIGLSFTDHSRRVELLRGEAYFSVARELRPFTVSAMGGSIRTQEARFNVHLAQERVAVAVAEHGVSLEPAGTMPQDLMAGWSSAYDRRSIYPATAITPDAVGAWRDGQLIFQNAPLATVLSEIERWRGGSISVWNESVAAIPVTAIFDTAQPEMALETMVQTLGLRMLDLPGGVTFIRAG